MHGALGNVDVRNLFVQKSHQRPHQPAFGLPLFAQKQHVVLGDQGQVDLGNDRVLVADDAGKQLFVCGQPSHEVIVDLALDGFGDPAALASSLQVGGLWTCEVVMPSSAVCGRSKAETLRARQAGRLTAECDLGWASRWRGLVQIVRDVRLPLVMRLVPGDDVQRDPHGQPRSSAMPAGLQSSRWSPSSPSVASNCSRVSASTRRMKRARVHRRPGCCRRGSVARVRHTRAASRCQPIGGEQLFGNADVHQLPADVARPGPGRQASTERALGSASTVDNVFSVRSRLNLIVSMMVASVLMQSSLGNR